MSIERTTCDPITILSLLVIITLLTTGCLGYGNTNIKSIIVYNRMDEDILVSVDISGDDETYKEEVVKAGDSWNLKEDSSHQPGVKITVRWYRPSEISGVSSIDKGLARETNRTNLHDGDFRVVVVVDEGGEILIEK